MLLAHEANDIFGELGEVLAAHRNELALVQVLERERQLLQVALLCVSKQRLVVALELQFEEWLLLFDDFLQRNRRRLLQGRSKQERLSGLRDLGGQLHLIHFAFRLRLARLSDHDVVVRFFTSNSLASASLVLIQGL